MRDRHGGGRDGGLSHPDADGMLLVETATEPTEGNESNAGEKGLHVILVLGEGWGLQREEAEHGLGLDAGFVHLAHLRHRSIPVEGAEGRGALGRDNEALLPSATRRQLLEVSHLHQLLALAVQVDVEHFLGRAAVAIAKVN